MFFVEILILIILHLKREYFCQIIPKIVGGTETSVEEWPFIAFLSLRVNGAESGCGASLLSERTALTAAHCLDDVTDKKKKFDIIEMNLLMGSTNIFETTMIRKVVDYETHEDYYVEMSFADIGIVYLQKPVVFSNTVKRTILRGKPLKTYDRLLMSAGWGAWSDPINKTHPFSTKLLYIYQMWVPDCPEYIRNVEEGTICAGEEDNIKYAYSGDSGGPLVIARGMIQVGLVSYKPEDKNGITVYTSIPYYYQWIKETQARFYKKYCELR